jgi:hypothetical protein
MTRELLPKTDEVMAVQRVWQFLDHHGIINFQARDNPENDPEVAKRVGGAVGPPAMAGPCAGPVMRPVMRPVVGPVVGLPMCGCQPKGLQLLAGRAAQARSRPLRQ